MSGWIREPDMKYAPLKHHLEGRFATSETPMSFREVEAVLGFPLPVSARKHQAWWSNTRHGHSHAAAWLDAGWRTANLDLAREAVTFIKDAASGLAEEIAPFRQRETERGAGQVILRLGDLSPMGQKLIQDHAEKHGGDLARAVVDVLNDAGYRRRRSLLDWFAQATPRLATNSVDLIREGRDER